MAAVDSGSLDWLKYLRPIDRADVGAGGGGGCDRSLWPDALRDLLGRVFYGRNRDHILYQMFTTDNGFSKLFEK